MAVVSVMFLMVIWLGEAGKPGGGVRKGVESLGGPNPAKERGCDGRGGREGGRRNQYLQMLQRFHFLITSVHFHFEI